MQTLTNLFYPVWQALSTLAHEVSVHCFYLLLGLLAGALFGGIVIAGLVGLLGVEL